MIIILNNLAALVCPKNLVQLWCHNNKINSLKHLPFSINYLICDNNPLSSKYQNKSLKEIHIINFKRKYNIDMILFEIDKCDVYDKNMNFSKADKKLNMIPMLYLIIV